MNLQTALRTIFPPQCLLCDERVQTEFGLCPSCWADAPMCRAPICDRCGAELPGAAQPGELLMCDQCMDDPPPWARGRAVFAYEGKARHLVMALKHGDRTDLARPAGRWMVRAAADIWPTDAVIVPVPLHPWRLWKRRYNQSALLAWALGRETRATVAVDALVRTRATRSQGHASRVDRMANLSGAIAPHHRHGDRLAGQNVVLVDDVMASGATLRSATIAAKQAGAKNVCVIALARAGLDA